MENKEKKLNRRAETSHVKGYAKFSFSSTVFGCGLQLPGGVLGYKRDGGGGGGGSDVIFWV